MERRTFLVGAAASAACAVAPATLGAAASTPIESIVMDSHRVLHACWTDPVTKWIKYQRFDWDGRPVSEVETIEQKGRPAISVDSYGVPHIAIRDVW